MELTGLCDMHTHSSFSPDAESDISLMCERAARLGLAAYAVTDHCECDLWLPAEEVSDRPEELTDREMYGARDYAPASIAAQLEMKKLYGERLGLICGIELGQPMRNIAAAERISSDPALDLIIGSHHRNAGKDDFYWLEYDKMEISEIYALMDDYFEQVLEMCGWQGFDVLGHLTYPLRYICGEYGIPLDLRRYEGIIKDIFRTLALSGRGIEINTSGLRQKYGLTFPHLEYVKLFREMGGEIITLGSDAHRAEDIGKGIAEGAQLAKAAGFKRVAVFIKRRAEFIELK